MKKAPNKNIKRLILNDKGAVAIEYGLIASLVVVVILASLGSLGNATTNMYNKITNAVVGAR